MKRITTGFLATLAYWAVIFLGPALILLANNIGYFVSGAGWGPDSIMFKALQFCSQPISCFLAYYAADSVSKGNLRACVLVNCIIGACICGMFVITANTMVLAASMIASAVCCIVTAVMSAKNEHNPK